MKLIVMFTAILAFGPLAFMQTAAPKEAPKPPVISDAQKLAYFKANSEFQTASVQVEQATKLAQQKQVALQAAGNAIVEACGKDFTATMDGKGDPACVAKPEPAKVETAKPAAAKK